LIKKEILMSYPRMVRIKQRFESIQKIEDIDSEIHEQLYKHGIMSDIKPEETVAITAGSRGITNIDRIMKAIVMELKEYGAKPFIIPAMGSHGNANAEGQREILEHYNVT